MIFKNDLPDLTNIIFDELNGFPYYTEVRLEETNLINGECTGDEHQVDIMEDEGVSIKTQFKNMRIFESMNNIYEVPKKINALKKYQKSFPINQIPQNPNLQKVSFTQEKIRLPNNLNDHFLDIFSQIARLNDQNEVKLLNLKLNSNFSKYIFLNTVGSQISQENYSFNLFLSCVTNSEAPFLHFSRYNTTNNLNFKKIKNWIEEETQTAINISKGNSVDPGKYNVIFSPAAAGALAHEIFGHLCEVDFFGLECDLEVKNYQINQLLNVVDDGTLLGLQGSYFYDDEGMPSSRKYIVKEGKLIRKLGNLNSSRLFGKDQCGNARTPNYKHAPIPRMSCTYIEPSNINTTDIITSVEKGIYIDGMRRGNTNGNTFIFVPEKSYFIRRGGIEENIKDVVIFGNIIDLIKNITAIGDDLSWAFNTGCIKSGIYLPKISWGGPHMLVSNIQVGKNIL